MAIDFGRPMGRSASIAVCAVCAVLYLIVGGRLQVFGCVPSYLLVMVACVSFIEGERTGCVVGFAAGLVGDLLGAGPVGLSALLMCIAGYALGYGRRDYLAQGWQRPLALLVAADVAYTVVYMLAASFIGSSGTALSEVLSVAVRGAVTDAMVGAIVLILVSRYLGRRSTRVSGLYLP